MNMFFDFWQRARKSPYSGDLFVGLTVFFLARAVPAWLGAWQPTNVEAGALGVAVAGLSMCFDLIPNETEHP